MTGVDLKAIWERKIDKTYSSFMNNVKLNALFGESLTLSVYDAYSSLQKDEVFEDISNLIKTNQLFYVNNNQVYIYTLDITNVTFAALVVTITTRLPHNLVVGDSVKFQNIAGFVAPTLNGTYHIVTSTPTSKTFTFNIAAIAGAHTANTGQLISHQLSGVDKLIPDFNYFLTVKQKFLQRQNFKVTGATNAQPIVMTVDKRNNLKTGEYITQSGIVGNTNANGSFYIKKLNSYKYALYRDQELTIPVSGNGTYQGIGKVDRVYYKVATPIFSSTKIDSFEKASVGNPRFERGNGFIKFHPLDKPCAEVTMDYITIPPVAIDVTDNIIDLEDTYAPEFLYYVMDKAANLFAQSVKDIELYNTSNAELSKI